MNSPSELLAQGFTLVTASNRLARHLHYQCNRIQLDAGKRSWESPNILPWGAWLQHMWEACSFHHPDKILLNSDQAQAIWHQLISSSPYAGKLWQSFSVAKRAIDAWELLHQYQIPIFPNDIYINEDVYAFKSWTEIYQQLCRESGWIDNASLIDVLAQHIGGAFQLPNNRLALFGFEQLTPQQHALFKAMEAAGATVIKAAPRVNNRSVAVTAYVDQRTEIKAAANWVRSQLSRNPQVSIGVVAADLHTLRSDINDCFDDVLTPGKLVDGDEADSPYSLSLGQPLLDYPLINTAMALLALGRGRFTFNEITVLLNTPFIKEAAGERFKRARFDACLREHGEAHLSLNTLYYVAENYLTKSERPTALLGCLKQVQAYLQQQPRRQSSHAWANHLTAILKLFGWPGERTLNSAEYQVAQAWQEVMARFITLQMVSPELNYGMAVSALRRITAEFNFQPESRETPVQIMGLVGTMDMMFDHLWVMGLHEEAWPPQPRSNPFIPQALQHRYQIPSATAESALESAQQRLSALVNSVADVVLSYPLNAQERPLRATPLLAGISHSGHEQLNVKTIDDYSFTIFASRKLERLIDNVGPAIEAGQHISGGTALFKDQAACPFRAFARHRLHAIPLASVDIGLNALDRGLMIHNIMQQLWGELRSHKTLMEMGESELESLITHVIDDVIASGRRRYPQTYTDKFSYLEKRRLKEIVNQWLEQERQRSDFTVEACELPKQFLFAGIDLNTRVDRIDKLADGRLVIVDYKTGESKVQQWFDERPDEPQLPLYAVTSGGSIAAITFAKIRRGEMGYIGLAEESDILPGTKAFAESRYAGDYGSWPALLSHWQESLTRLADAFRRGRADVDPKQSSSCRYCDQHTFCRIYQLQVTGHKSQGVFVDDE